jgi:hypothetical protein
MVIPPLALGSTLVLLPCRQIGDSGRSAAFSGGSVPLSTKYPRHSLELCAIFVGYSVRQQGIILPVLFSQRHFPLPLSTILELQPDTPYPGSLISTQFCKVQKLISRSVRTVQKLAILSTAIPRFSRGQVVRRKATSKNPPTPQKRVLVLLVLFFRCESILDHLPVIQTTSVFFSSLFCPAKFVP